MSTPPGFFYNRTELDRLGISESVQKKISQAAWAQQDCFIMLRVIRGFAACPRLYLDTLHPDELAMLFTGFPMTAPHQLHCLALMGWEHAQPDPADYSEEQRWAISTAYFERGDFSKIKINRAMTPIEDLLMVAKTNDFASFKARVDVYFDTAIDWNLLVCVLVANQCNKVLVECLRHKIISPDTLYSIDESRLEILEPLLPYALKHRLGYQCFLSLNSTNLVKLSLLYGNRPLLHTLNRHVGDLFASLKENNIDIMTSMLFRQHHRVTCYLLQNKIATFEQPRAGQVTALHAASACHFPHLQRDSTFFIALTKFAKKCVNHQDENGETALHLAVRMKNLAMIQWLLSMKANPNLQNNLGQTPLEVLFTFPKASLFISDQSIFIEILDCLAPQQKNYDRLLMACLNAICSQHITPVIGARCLPLAVMIHILKHLVDHLSAEACSHILEQSDLRLITETQVGNVDIEALSQVIDVLHAKVDPLPRDMSHLKLFELFGTTEESDSDDQVCRTPSKRAKVGEEEADKDIACTRSNSW